MILDEEPDDGNACYYTRIEGENMQNITVVHVKSWVRVIKDVEAKICGQILSGGAQFLLLIPTKILDFVFWWEAGSHIHIIFYWLKYVWLDFSVGRWIRVHLYFRHRKWMQFSCESPIVTYILIPMGKCRLEIMHSDNSLCWNFHSSKMCHNDIIPILLITSFH